MPKIFISYRREDSAYPAHQIYEKLTDHFGSESVVFDIDTTPLGTDFREYLNMQVSECDQLLAVIGDQWLEILKQRIDEPNDFVRIEIQAALERDIPVIPILVGKASVPSEKDLPPKLVALSYRNAAEVRAGPDFADHLKRLIKGLDHLKDERKDEEEGKRIEVETKIKPKKSESHRVKPLEPKPDATATTEPKSHEPGKPDKALKLGAVAGVILLLIGGIWWYIKNQQIKEAHINIDKISTKLTKLESEGKKVSNSYQQAVDLYRKKEETINEINDLRQSLADERILSLSQLKNQVAKLQITFTNRIGMTFVLIPMREMTDIDENVGMKESIKSFFIQTTEVTQEQWKKVMGDDNPSYFKKCGDNCPVERVSWDDAQEFISKLNEKEGTDVYRLPIVAEWEYACLAEITSDYSPGDDSSTLFEYAWYSINSRKRTHPVGKKKPNAWGLYDMRGNVWEWCQDLIGEYRELRGGSWFNNKDDARCAASVHDESVNRDTTFGFRCVGIIKFS